MSDKATNLLVSMSVTVLSTSFISRNSLSSGAVKVLSLPLTSSATSPFNAEPVRVPSVLYLRVTSPRPSETSLNIAMRLSASIVVDNMSAFMVSSFIIEPKSMASTPEIIEAMSLPSPSD